MRSTLRFVLPVLVLGATIACSDTGVGPSNKTVAISADFNSGTVNAGDSAQFELSVARQGGFAGTVMLIAQNLPAGVVATFSPSTLPDGSASSTLTLRATDATTPATFRITIDANGDGVSAQATTIEFSVRPAGSAPIKPRPAHPGYTVGDKRSN